MIRIFYGIMTFLFFCTLIGFLAFVGLAVRGCDDVNQVTNMKIFDTSSMWEYKNFQELATTYDQKVKEYRRLGKEIKRMAKRYNSASRFWYKDEWQEKKLPRYLDCNQVE